MGSNNSKPLTIPPGHIRGICLENIRMNVTKEHLKTYFSEYGSVVCHAILNGNAYVAFNERAATQQVLAKKYCWIRGYRYKVRSCIIKSSNSRSSSETSGANNVAYRSSTPSLASSPSPSAPNISEITQSPSTSTKSNPLRASNTSIKSKPPSTSSSETLQIAKIIEKIGQISLDNKKLVNEIKELKIENERFIEQLQCLTTENGILVNKSLNLENQNKSYEMIMKENQDRRTNTSFKITGEECIFCFTNRPDHAILKCGHVCICSECVEDWRKKDNKCPICRKNFHSIQKLYF